MILEGDTGLSRRCFFQSSHRPHRFPSMTWVNPGKLQGLLCTPHSRGRQAGTWPREGVSPSFSPAQVGKSWALCSLISLGACTGRAALGLRALCLMSQKL